MDSVSHRSTASHASQGVSNWNTTRQTLGAMDSDFHQNTASPALQPCESSTSSGTIRRMVQGGPEEPDFRHCAVHLLTVRGGNSIPGEEGRISLQISTPIPTPGEEEPDLSNAKHKPAKGPTEEVFELLRSVRPSLLPNLNTRLRLEVTREHAQTQSGDACHSSATDHHQNDLR